MRAADDKLARGIDVVLDVVAEEGEHLVRVYLGLDAGHEDVDDIGLDAVEHALVVAVKLIVLRAHHDGVDAQGHVVVAVLYRDLTLGIGTQVGHLSALLAYVGEGSHDEVSQVERHGHVVIGLVAGVAEHHALVAGALVVLDGTAHTAVDVGALLVNGAEDAARVTVKLVLGLGVTYLLDSLAGYGLQVYISFRGHLAHDNHLSGGYEGLDGAVGMVVVGQKLV